MDKLRERYPSLSACREEIEAALEVLIKAYSLDGKLLLCGNGGSAADCDHIAGELLKGFMKKRPLPEEKRAEMLSLCPSLDGKTLNSLQMGLPAIPLHSAAAFNTAYSNDVSPELVYAQAALSLGKGGDVLLAISTSGNSRNVLHAARVAKALGIKVIGLSGKGGGELSALADVCICVPETETYKVQELHLPVYHYLCQEIEKHFFDC